MTSFDSIHSTSTINNIIWTTPTKARRGRPTKTPGKIQQRIESIVMGILANYTTDGDMHHVGIRMEDLSRITGYTAAQIRPVMQALVANGSVKRTGSTRGTRYMAVAL